jgi:hypothetical protein
MRFSHTKANTRLGSTVDRVAVLAFNLGKKVLELDDRSNRQIGE